MLEITIVSGLSPEGGGRDCNMDTLSTTILAITSVYFVYYVFNSPTH